MLSFNASVGLKQISQSVPTFIPRQFQLRSQNDSRSVKYNPRLALSESTYCGEHFNVTLTAKFSSFSDYFSDYQQRFLTHTVYIYRLGNRIDDGAYKCFPLAFQALFIIYTL
jgi:hypothetical protein